MISPEIEMHEMIEIPKKLHNSNPNVYAVITSCTSARLREDWVESRDWVIHVYPIISPKHTRFQVGSINLSKACFRNEINWVRLQPRTQTLPSLESLGKNPDEYIEIGRERARVLGKDATSFLLKF